MKRQVLKNCFTERWIAHRGFYNEKIAENSLRAFRHAVDCGYYMELDVQLSKDGKVVVFHDDFLDRMVCGKRGETMPLKDYTYDELQKFVLSGHDQDRVPLFEDVLAYTESSTVIVEIKNRTLTEQAGELEQKTLEILKKYHGNFAVQSFNPFAVDFFTKHAPEFTRGLLINRERFDQYPTDEMAALVKMMIGDTEKRIDFIDCATDECECEISSSRDPRLGLISYTVISQEIMDKLEPLTDNLIFEGFIPREKQR
ncbi:MAG TPA: hypothetical protein H9728_06990 [Candidatus Borkfalkia excrementavium]|uniref:GP-PDE domain-containing protein n=1 Tax=Candidatus Borkfalkia excrementavium TaxID=2838505 RepID=A0A9D1Z8R0_9FIRM|nr:hypothetical protein [Candidatus Borkfalkia excrementavium]